MSTTVARQGDFEQTRDIARQAAAVFGDGGLVVFPTETVYGIGALASSDVGYGALRRAKGRSNDQPFTIHLSSPSEAGRYVDLAGPIVGRAVRKLLPGPVTVVLDVPDGVIDAKIEQLGANPSLRDRLYWQGTVGLRCPDNWTARQILGSVDGPVVASSANRPDQPPPYDAAAVDPSLGDQVALIIDDGRCRYAKPSTIVRVRQGAGRGPGPGALASVAVLREGVYDQRFISRLMNWTMLLVCTGNTCRSAMAEVLARHLLAKRLKVSDNDLEAAGFTVMSAGMMAATGMGASDSAVAAMRKIGLDLTGHRSRPITDQLVRQADVVYCMTESHCRAVLAGDPTAGDKVFLLDPSGDVDDPVGGSEMVYQRCAELIRRQLERRLKEQHPCESP